MTSVCERYISPQDLYTLQYEELAQNPVQSLSTIGKKFGINLDDYSINQFREYKNYGVSGNKSRWEDKTISLDEKWKKQMPSKYVRLVNWCTQKLATKYGYEAMG